MSRFIVSFSREETEAALAYYSSHATQFPPLVSGFFQTLLHQFSNESHSETVSQDTSFRSASTDVQSTTKLQMKTTNVSHAATISTIHTPHLSQTIRPYLLTPSPSPPRISPEDERFQNRAPSPSNFSQTTPTTNQSQRGGFSLPMSSPLKSRISQDTNSVQSGVGETRLSFLESVETTVDSGNTGQKDSPPSLPTASPFPRTFPQDGESRFTTTLPKDFLPTTPTTWRGFALPNPSPPLPETRPPSPSVGSVSVDTIPDTVNTAQKLGIEQRGLGDGTLSAKGVGDSDHMDVQNSRKRKRPMVAGNEDSNDFVEEHNLEQDDLADDEEEEDDENDGDYVEGNAAETNRGSRGGRSSRGSRGGRGGRGSRGRGRRGGGGGGNCSRNGENVTRRHTGQQSRSSALESDTGNTGDPSTPAYAGPVGSTGAGTATGSNLNNSFIYSPDRAPPSQEIQQESTLLLLALSSSPDSLDWVKEFVKAIEGEPWAESDALTTKSLKNLALRCSRSKNMDVFATFCRMLNELMFTAKVNSIIHAQQRACPSRTPSVKGILNSLKQEGFNERELGTWMSCGSRWARVAGAASIYSLILIAEKRLSYRWGREISSATLIEACHQMRSPSNKITLGLVQDGLIPTTASISKITLSLESPETPPKS
ncbi:hypothetical protein F5880DRAFT_1652887 [Lentinula raphanica]|nr:hypothetical protein F5880DRAFT_1652887 [Lentinula raphanica]